MKDQHRERITALETEVNRIRDLALKYIDERDAALEAIKPLQQTIKVLEAKNANLEAKCGVMKAALKFYADENDWREHWFKVQMSTNFYHDNEPPKHFCGWKIASEALKESEGVG